MNFAQILRASESDNGRTGRTFDASQVPMTFAELREAGYQTPARLVTPAHRQNFRDFCRLYERVLAGDRRAIFYFQEAMSSSDFSTYMGNVMDRSVLANYAETPYTWDRIAQRATMRDLTRTAQIFRLDRGESVLDGPVIPDATYDASGSGDYGLKPMTEYPERRIALSNYTDRLYKFGARMAFSWEALLADDLDLLRDVPRLFGRAARRTEEKRATALWLSSTGPNATFFAAGNNNRVRNDNTVAAAFVTTNNPPLSVQALGWAITLMAMQRDEEGNPIDIEAVELVVPPALRITAMNIVNSLEILLTNDGGTAGTAQPAQQLRAQNWARGMSFSVNYFMPIINTTSPHTTWALFASPRTGRPALRLSFLAGHESPEIFQKAQNSVRVGGGMGAMEMDGDFDTDAGSIHKVRHCIGGTTLDPKMAIASNGTGS